MHVLSSLFINFDDISSILDYHKAPIKSMHLSFGETNTTGKFCCWMLDLLDLTFLI